MNRRTFLLLLRGCFTILLLTLVIWKAGLFSHQGRTAFAELVLSANFYYLLVSLFIHFSQNISSSIKWWMLLLSRKIKVPLFRLWAYYLVGQFYNLILPTSMGGDVVRIHELSRYTGQGAEAVASVFMERFTGVVVLVGLALGVMLLNLSQFNHALINTSFIGFTTIVFLIGWVILDQRPFLFMQTRVKRLFPALEPLMEKIGKCQGAVHEYRRDGSALLWAFINSAIFFGLAILNVWFSALAFDTQISLMAACIATPVILLIMNLPISIGGIGLMEFAFTFTFDLIGIGSAVGFSTALVLRFKILLDGGIGAVLHPFVARGRSITREISATDAVERG
ncbi:MAG: UPF0104 family protein [Desulfobulbaceae bacterium]|nr:MAG: UPF0104 family protein [Desulfobulbaceae bacterium]